MRRRIVFASPPPAGTPEHLAQALIAQGVRDRCVIEAFRRVRREDFVPPDWVGQAYVDRPIPIPHDQVTTQPSLVAQMVAALRLRGDERVLEVGTGLGFQTAILATLAREVFSVERFTDLAKAARSNLEAAGVTNAVVVVGDGTLGFDGHAPYDAVVVSAAALEVPPPLIAQLEEGGWLVHPIGPGGQEVVVSFLLQGGRLIREADLTGAHFVRLIGKHGLSDRD